MIVIGLLALVLVCVLAVLREAQKAAMHHAEILSIIAKLRVEIDGRLTNMMDTVSLAAGSEGRAKGRAEEREAAAAERAVILLAEQKAAQAEGDLR